MLLLIDTQGGLLPNLVLPMVHWPLLVNVRRLQQQSCAAVHHICRLDSFLLLLPPPGSATQQAAHRCCGVLEWHCEVYANQHLPGLAEASTVDCCRC